jgi:hypothetical protein
MRIMHHFSRRHSSAALALAATMSLAAAVASSLGPTAAYADAPLGVPVGTLALNCGTGQGASATATIDHGALVDGDFRFSYTTTSGATGYTDMPVGVIESPARTTDFVANVTGVAGARYTSVTLYAVGAVGVTLSSAACG